MEEAANLFNWGLNRSETGERAPQWTLVAALDFVSQYLP
jgi:hypothetical protein